MALLDNMVVHHGNKKLNDNTAEKTLHIDLAYTHTEKAWRGMVIAQYGCCQYMHEARTRWVEEEKPEFFKCECDSQGLYC